jgi:hypothetical protein
VLSAVLGRDLRFEAQSDEEARAEMNAAMPPEYVDAFFSFNVAGTLDESRVLPPVEQVTGRRPGTFEEWARRMWRTAKRFQSASTEVQCAVGYGGAIER